MFTARTSLTDLLIRDLESALAADAEVLAVGALVVFAALTSVWVCVQGVVDFWGVCGVCGVCGVPIPEKEEEVEKEDEKEEEAAEEVSEVEGMPLVFLSGFW
ncbi:hypothetical protein L873DRAFT_1788220 [Choiromyces venosus 120613-1]|uniref:Uncharacterized protein n=1 Tax=Choiromyces venosus 120613-1 TaxID=1336337 RepID=A0A3N4JXJ2_9PEZI|nr:hypothetical protein L873DRAFT_1788220 [Choiromyces venosus 120613-1]